MACLGLVGCGISIYLALDQYGVVAAVWDPVFGDGSQRVLHDDLLAPVSQTIGLPIHDALLGAIAYAVEAVLALAMRRPRRSDALAVAYVALVAMLGVTGLTLVAVQAIAVGAWCMLCLASAGISAAIVFISRADFAEVILKIGQMRRRVDSQGEARQKTL